MPPTVLYSENNYPDDSVERHVYGPDVNVVFPKATTSLTDLPDEECAQRGWADDLRYKVTQKDSRCSKLRFVRRWVSATTHVDRVACANRYRKVERARLRHDRGRRPRDVPRAGSTPRPVPASGGTACRSARTVAVHHRSPGQAERRADVRYRRHGPHRHRGRSACQGVQFPGSCSYDPHLPNGVELGLGVLRAKTLEELLGQTDTLSVHTPLTPETRGMLGLKELSLLPKGAVVVNTARGPIVDIDALATLLKSGHLSGVGIDVIPVEPPVEPVPELVRAYRARKPWTIGRLIITPHSAFYTPQAWDDIRSKGAETMAAALLGKPQNVIDPGSY